MTRFIGSAGVALPLGRRLVISCPRKRYLPIRSTSISLASSNVAFGRYLRQQAARQCRETAERKRFVPAFVLCLETNLGPCKIRHIHIHVYHEDRTHTVVKIATSVDRIEVVRRQIESALRSHSFRRLRGSDTTYRVPASKASRPLYLRYR